MTYSKLTYPISPPAQPDGLIETDHLHYLMGRLTRCEQICLGQLNGPQEPWAHENRQRLTSRWLRAARDLARLGREVFRLEKHNHFIKTKWEMLRDPKWRARVFRELGGEVVMRKWEQRFAKAKDREPQPEPLGPQYIKPVPDGALFKQTKRNSVRTDRAGQFRLAPIERGPRAWRLKVTLRRFRTYSWDPSWESREREFPPIPVTPGELRGDTINTVIPALSRDLGSIGVGELDILSMPKLPRSASVLFERNPGLAAAGLIRDDKNEVGVQEDPP